MENELRKSICELISFVLCGKISLGLCLNSIHEWASMRSRGGGSEETPERHSKAWLMRDAFIHSFLCFACLRGWQRRGSDGLILQKADPLIAFHAGIGTFYEITIKLQMDWPPHEGRKEVRQEVCACTLAYFHTTHHLVPSPTLISPFCCCCCCCSG